MFKGIILGQFFEWILIAVIGGGVIGALICVVSRRLAHRRISDVNVAREEITQRV